MTIRTLVLRRALLVLASFVVLGLACGAGARADIIEYCPVEFASPPQAVSATELGMQFESDGPRTVSGSLLLLTSGGWYQADFTNVPVITQKTVNGSDRGITYTRHPYRSETFYAQVPNAGAVIAAFIAQAQATGDPSYGWDQRGMVACDPPPNPRVGVGKTTFGEEVVALPAPQISSVVVHAQAVAAPSGFSIDCKTPFANVQQTSRANSELDTNDLGVRGRFAVYIRVAVNDQGKVDGAWPWVSSGYPEYDRAMVQEAERSTYVPARSFCAPVRAYYDIRITMNDNRR
jgi:hypothetical protein